MPVFPLEGAVMFPNTYLPLNIFEPRYLKMIDYSMSQKNRLIGMIQPKKIRDKETMQKYLDADNKLSSVSLKVEYYDTMLNYLESILKVIQNRTYQIKNAIEFIRFQSGLG